MSALLSALFGSLFGYIVAFCEGITLCGYLGRHTLQQQVHKLEMVNNTILFFEQKYFVHSPLMFLQVRLR